MKSSHQFNFLSVFTKFKEVAILLLFFGLFFSTKSIEAQDLTKGQTEEVIKSIAKYTSGVSDKTSQLIKKHGYQPPAYLAKEWKQYPAVRKIEMAYAAAENAQKGKGGKKFLALLSKDLAQRYEAVNHEGNLNPLIKDDLKSQKLKFKHPKKYGKVNLPNQVKKQILSISKYTEVGALGGTRGVLKHKFGLPDNQVYDILRSSNSSQEALEKGLSKSKVPPSHQERLKNVSNELQNKYDAARKDKALTEATKSKNSSSNRKQTTRKKVVSDFTKKTESKPQTIKPNETLTKARYKSYTKANYSAPGAKKFRSMRTRRGGFGGVIFGNEVKDKTNLPALKYFRFIPSEYLSPDGMPMGILELIFEDGSEYMVSSILLEDIVAANEIVFGDEIEYHKGDGIGLAGIENSISYPDSSSRWEVVVHPAIANFELGWAALLSDVYPIASQEMLEKLKEGSSEQDYYTSYLWSALLTPQTWKITDVPISIANEDNQLRFFRHDIVDSLRVQDAFITMQGFGNDELPMEEKLFYKIVPSLSNSIYEFHRINEFAKTLALFRWVKEKGGALLNFPKDIKYVEAPESIFVTKDRRIEYYTIEEESINFRNFKNDALDNIDYELTRTSNDELILLHKSFLNELKKYSNKLSHNWKLLQKPLLNQVEICELEIFTPDSVLATSNFNRILPKSSKIYLLDSLNNHLQIRQQELTEIELTRFLIISRADTLLAETEPDSLMKFQELVASIRNFVGETQEEENDFTEKTLLQIDDLLSNTIEDYSLLLLYKAFSTFSIEELKEEITNVEMEVSGYKEWREKYIELINILSTEKSIIEATRNRYCIK